VYMSNIYGMLYFKIEGKINTILQLLQRFFLDYFVIFVLGDSTCVCVSAEVATAAESVSVASPGPYCCSNRRSESLKSLRVCHAIRIMSLLKRTVRALSCLRVRTTYTYEILYT
jgi:hypothetical protein